ncbi:MAG: putative DNA modification/repair radical SAM protein [Oscillospiraceae bacterium]|jgi:putative DNA modification/repair radical SAM protein|nr:putative DNA modification/repair radical SAM protein [Oscillospiraceae bacterium]
MEKLNILGDAAKFDASCASSGSGRAGKPGQLGNAFSSGICHTWAADGRCICLLKVLLSNACIYDCQYCQNRRSNDIPRATFQAEELAELTIQFYRRNYIEGLFLSSGVVRNADHTMEQMIRVMRILRETHKFGGYIHVKTIPGADLKLVEAAGLLTDRVSVNIELPSSGSLSLLAPDKKPEMIFTPMRGIESMRRSALEDGKKHASAPLFAPAGQSTQMIVGATGDTDRTILRLSGGLYQKFRLKRVYFSAYIPIGTHPALPPRETAAVPLLREHRLYQSDWLMRFYSFSADEITEDGERLDMEVDPKCAWALRHPEFFPVEVNRADREALLRVPGVGMKSADKIIEARRFGPIRAEHLRKLGIVMKRARFFLTAGGKYEGEARHDHPFLRELLTDRYDNGQLSLFGGGNSPPRLPGASEPLTPPAALPLSPPALPDAPPLLKLMNA